MYFTPDPNSRLISLNPAMGGRFRRTPRHPQPISDQPLRQDSTPALAKVQMKVAGLAAQANDLLIQMVMRIEGGGLTLQLAN